MVDFETLTKPVSEDDPCGPDLDLAGDAAYMNFMASAEGVLPPSYFVKDQSGNERPFDRATANLSIQFDAAKPFLARTCDLRLLGMLAKFSILDRDLAGFIVCIRAIETLLDQRWDEVHPRAEEGDFGMRMVAIESLDALPTVIMPLQFLPLVESRRFGAISYRSQMMATGEIQPREGEEPLDRGSIDKALEGAELPALIDRRQQLVDLKAALSHIPQIWLEKSGSDRNVSLERPTTLVGRMIEFLDAAITLRDPSAALTPIGTGPAGEDAGSTGVAVTVGPVRSATEAAAALLAIDGYFSRSEPSNPALLLVRQAHQLIGKSFLEVLQILVPTQVERATINIGRDQFFDLPVERLAAFANASDYPIAAEPEEPVSDPAYETGTASDDAIVDEPADGAADETVSTTPEEPADAPLEKPPAASSPGAGRGNVSAATFQATSRAEALALLDQVGLYLRAAEPSSPVPFLTERARDLAQRDFLSLLKALLPADAFRSENAE